MFVKGIKNNLDSWSGWHLFGPYVLADWYGWIVAAICVVAWECADLAWWRYVESKRRVALKGVANAGVRLVELIFPYHWIDKVFDRRGISWGDLLCGAAGIGLFLIHGAI